MVSSNLKFFKIQPSLVIVTAIFTATLLTSLFVQAVAENPETLLGVGMKTPFCQYCSESEYRQKYVDALLDDPTVSIEEVMMEESKISISKKLAQSANREKRFKSQGGFCWRGVKEILLRARVIKYKSELPSVDAREADKDLERIGFVNLMSRGEVLEFAANPCLAPKGAVLVYSGGKISIDPVTKKPRCGKSPCGHVEMKSSDPGKPQVVSDFRSGVPITGGCFALGRHYKLKAIMVHPDLDDDLADRVLAKESLRHLIKSLFETDLDPIPSI